MMWSGKNLMVAVILLVFGLLVAGCAAEVGKVPIERKNLIANGSFEDGLEGWSTGSWDITVQDGALTIKSANGKDRISSGTTVRDIEIGESYALTAKMRTVGEVVKDRESSQAYVRVRAAGASGNTHPLVYTERISAETNGWQDLEASITLPEGTTRVHIEIFVEYLEGTFQFTDFAFVEL